MDHPTRPTRLAPFAVALITAGAFLPVLVNGWVEWDDRENYLENPMYRGLGPANLRWMLASDHVGVYQPVGWMASAAQYLAFGLDARGYHATALAVHGLNAGLVYCLVVALLRRARPGASLGPIGVGAFWAACLWGVHPLRVEVVAWVSAQHYTFCACFGLLCTLCYLKAHPEGSPTHPGWLAASVLLLVAALASKAAAAGIVGALAVLDVYPLRRRGEIGRAMREKVWFLIPTAAFAATAVRAKAANGSLAAVEASGLGARVAQSCYGLMFYLYKTIWPVNLCTFYPLPERVDWRIWPFSASLAAASLLAVLAASNRRRRPSPAASGAAYLALALPMIGLVRVGAQVAADRYSYLASIPLAALLAGCIAALARRGGTRGITAAGWVAVGVLVALSWVQSATWRDSRSLARQALAAGGERSAEIQCAAAMADASAGDFDAAIARYRHAMELEPTSSRPHNGLGVLLLGRNRPDEALAEFDLAARLHPELAEPHNNRGAALGRMGRIGEAAQAFARAAVADPSNRSARDNLRRANDALGSRR